MPGRKVINISIALILFLFWGSYDVSAQNANPTQKISISFINSTLDEALAKLTTKFKVPIAYDPTLLKNNKLINRQFVSESLTEILDQLLSGTRLSYKRLQDEYVITFAQSQNFTISGHIRDAESGEDLIGASIYIPELKLGVTSNSYGFYSLTLPNLKTQSFVSHLGYLTKEIDVDQNGDSEVQDIILQKQAVALHEVIVSNSKSDALGRLLTNSALDWEQMKKQPFYKGEPDVIKSLQMQNGILSLSEGSSSLFVRGGNRDQNLFLLDEAAIYNPAHLLGLTSIFNTDAIKSIQIYKDDIPANFGGRLSSVIDARMNDGNDQTFHVKGGVSLLSAHLALEGPIVPEKSSFFIAARKSTSNILGRSYEIFNLSPSYYDINFKVNYKFDNSTRIFLSSYLGNDHLKSADNYSNKWGNSTATLRLNHVFSPKLFLNLSAIYSNYKNSLNINADSAAGMDNWSTGIRDFTLKSDFNLYLQPGNKINFGLSLISHLFTPGEAKTASYLSIPRARADEYAGYASHDLDVNYRLKLVYGSRLSLFRNISTSKLTLIDDNFNITDTLTDISGGYQSFLRLEPRVKIQYALTKRSDLQFSYNRTYQYLQLIQNDELAFSSLETWIPSSPNIQPQQADLFSLTYNEDFKNYSFSASAYYKKMQNQLELVDHAQIILNPFIEDLLRPGKAFSYGTELMLSKNSGRLTGTLLYTFSRAFRIIGGINKGLRYPANYDIPHVLKINLNYQISKRLSTSCFFTYTTGRPVTLPVGYYVQQGIKVPIYKDRNASRLPDYNRMDINLNWDLTPQERAGKQKWSSILSAGLYNVYGKKNILYYKIDQSSNAAGNLEQQSFSGVVPSLAYNFKF